MPEDRGGDAGWREHASDEWSDAVVAAMKLGGIDHLFFVSGSELSFFQEAIVKAEALGRPAPRLVTMLHESVALHAAIGVSMVTRQPSAAAVHVDVGTLHFGAAIHAAWRGGYPVMMIAGSAPRAVPGSMPGARDNQVQFHQEPRDLGEIVRQYSKMDHRMEHQDNPGLMVSRLLQVAMSAPRGPVHLTVPRETAMLPLPGSIRFPTRDDLGVARPVWPDPDDARTIARWLVESEHPLLCSSHVGEDPEAVEELVALAELLAVPVTEVHAPSRMNFPRTHPLHGTGPAPKDVDVMLFFESIPLYLPGPDAPPGDAKVAWVGSDPVHSRTKTLMLVADLWIPATASKVARAVREAAEPMLTRAHRARIADRRERLERRKQEMAEHERRAALDATSAPTPTGRLVGFELGKLLDSSAIVLNDALGNARHVDTYVKRDRPGTYFRSGSSAGGWGVGAAFGAKLAAPDVDVVHATGDGFFTYGSPTAALWAERYHRAPVLTVVFVNASYGTGIHGLRSDYPTGYALRSGNFVGGTFDPPPDFAKLGEVAGGYGEHVTETAEVGPALRRGLEHVRSGVPAVIAVRVPAPHAAPVSERPLQW